jgi:anti-sigma-K factor RskA
MTHDELDGLYELYALGVLDAEEKDEIDEHLARECRECTAQLRRAVEVTALFATLPEQVTPPKRLRKRVLASVGARQAAPPWTMVWAAAAACLAIALVVVGMKMAGDLDDTHRELRAANAEREQARRELQSSQRQVSDMQAALQFLNEPETVVATFGGGAPLPPRGRILVNPNRGVLLIASHLPPAPEGKTYEMWVVPKKGAPQPAGLFQSDAQGNVMHLLPGRVDRAQTAAIAVSLEPQSGSPAPTTKPFIVAPLGD